MPHAYRDLQMHLNADKSAGLPPALRDKPPPRRRLAVTGERTASTPAQLRLNPIGPRLQNGVKRVVHRRWDTAFSTHSNYRTRQPFQLDRPAFGKILRQATPCPSPGNCPARSSTIPANPAPGALPPLLPPPAPRRWPIRWPPWSPARSSTRRRRSRWPRKPPPSPRDKQIFP